MGWLVITELVRCGAVADRALSGCIRRLGDGRAYRVVRLRRRVDLCGYGKAVRLTFGPVHPWKLALARRFRAQPTRAEATAWALLRDRRMLGLKFRRQRVIAGYVVDFYCAALGLALELDGGVHYHRAQAVYDMRRDQILSAHGVDVLRVPNAQANQSALQAILQSYLEHRHALSTRTRP